MTMRVTLEPTYMRHFKRHKFRFSILKNHLSVQVSSNIISCGFLKSVFGQYIQFVPLCFFVFREAASKGKHGLRARAAQSPTLQFCAQQAHSYRLFYFHFPIHFSLQPIMSQNQLNSSNLVNEYGFQGECSAWIWCLFQ